MISIDDIEDIEDGEDRESRDKMQRDGWTGDRVIERRTIRVRVIERRTIENEDQEHRDDVGDIRHVEIRYEGSRECTGGQDETEDLDDTWP